ncbi:MAG: hypothetical protein AAGD01_05345 [Acidobacteriota bacterium]
MLALCIFIFPYAVADEANGGGYDSPPTLAAADLLPPELLKGDRFAVDPEVPTDGFMGSFTVHSDYGTFRPQSLEETVIVVHEIGAIQALDEMSQARVAGEAVVEGVTQPFLAAFSVLSRPEETVEQVGESVGRWIERGKLSLYQFGRKAKKTVNEAQEEIEERWDERQQRRAEQELAEQEVRARALEAGEDPDAAVNAYRQRQEQLAEEQAQSAEAIAEAEAKRREQAEWVSEQLEKAAYKYLGYDRARRSLARELRVDPYSTNLELQKRLDAMAWAQWAGQFGSGYVVPSNEVLSQLESVDDLVWVTHPKDLEVENRKRLKAMGVERKLIDAFYDHPLYTTSQRTAMVTHLNALEGVEHRDAFFRLAVAAESFRGAAFFHRTARLLERTHRQRPLQMLAPKSERFVAAITPDGGNLVLVLPVDHLAWTESIDLVASGVQRHCESVDFEGETIVLLGGDLTDRARQGIESLGWKVETWGLGVLGNKE